MASNNVLSEQTRFVVHVDHTCRDRPVERARMTAINTLHHIGSATQHAGTDSLDSPTPAHRVQSSRPISAAPAATDTHLAAVGRACFNRFQNTASTIIGATTATTATIVIGSDRASP